MDSFEEGQIWKYHTRHGEEESRLYIAMIDRLRDGVAFHIFVDGLHLKNPRIAGGFQDTLPHAPVSEETLKASVVSLVAAHAPMPDITEGYAIWHEAYEKGEGGVFDIPVAKIVEYIEGVVSDGHHRNA